MHTENSVLIKATVETIYDYSADIQRWPQILPHYRWVKMLRQDGNRRLIEMAARRGRIPIRWWAEQELFPDEPRITYRHVGGVTKCMEVVWTFEPVGDDVQVTIRHDLRLGWPLIGGWVADKIIGPMFVANIAGKTLRTIKTLAEAQASYSTKPAAEAK